MAGTQSIGVFTPFFPPFEGGAERVAARTATMLAERGHRVVVHTLDQGTDRLRSERIGNVDVHRHPVRFVRIGGFTTARSASLVDAVRTTDADVLHIHNTIYPVLLHQIAVAARRSGVPTMLVTHGIFEAIEGNYSGMRGRAYRMVMHPILRSLFRQITAVGALSRFDLGELADINVRPHLHHILFNGVDMPHLSNGQAAAGKRSSLRLMHTASVKPNKGHLDMLSAVGRLKGDIDVEYHVVGSGGPIWADFEASVRQAAQQQNLADRVVFHGRVDDDERDRLYDKADIVVVPSHAETFPLAALEGMSYAKPVVATRVGGIEDMIDDGRTGLLVPPRSPEALAEAIRRLRDTALQHDIGRRAREHVERQFTWRSVVDRYEELSRRMVGT